MSLRDIGRVGSGPTGELDFGLFDAAQLLVGLGEQIVCQPPAWCQADGLGEEFCCLFVLFCREPHPPQPDIARRLIGSNLDDTMEALLCLRIGVVVEQ